MSGFFLAFGFFLFLHLIPAFRGLRGQIVGAIGLRWYIAIYSAASTAALAWLFAETFRLDYVELWAPMAWQAVPAFILSPLGLFLVICGMLSRNPFSITFRSGPGADAIVSVTRHPVLWGFLAWASGHIPANGDLRSLLLFGGFALFAAVGFFTLERKAKRRLGDAWKTETANSSILPFKALALGRAAFAVDLPFFVSVVSTLVATAVLLSGVHALLLGADPLLLLSGL